MGTWGEALIANGFRVSFSSYKKVLISTVMMVAHSCEYTKKPLDTLNGWMVWHVNYILVKLLKKENTSLSLWKADNLYLLSSINILTYQVNLEKSITTVRKTLRKHYIEVTLWTIQGNHLIRGDLGMGKPEDKSRH